MVFLAPPYALLIESLSNITTFQGDESSYICPSIIYKHMPRLHSIVFLLCLPLILPSQTVRHAGAMRNVMMGISLDNNIQWDTIQGEYIFGIGPLEGLKGEVTVANSQIYISRVDAAGNLVLTQEEKTAIFLINLFMIPFSKCKITL
jgi:hypothetical protein